MGNGHVIKYLHSTLRYCSRSRALPEKSGLVRLGSVPLPEICIPASTNDTEKVESKYQQGIFHISKCKIINVSQICH